MKTFFFNKKIVFSLVFLLQITPIFGLTKDEMSTTRPLSMGGAFTAIADDYNATVWNPAAMDSGIFRPQFGMSYAKQYEDINSYFFSLIYPTISSGTFGFYLNAYSYGTLQQYDSTGNRLSDFSRKDYLAGIAYGKKIYISYKNLIDLKFNFGLALKYAYVNIDDYSSASGYSSDFSLYWPISEVFSTGLILKNLGGLDLKDDSDNTQRIESPSTRIGLSIKATKDLLFSADIEKTSSLNDKNYSVGAEFKLLGIIFRSGILGNEDSLSLCGGVGVRLGSGMAIDYAFLNHETLGSNHRFAIGFPFGKDIIKQGEENKRTKVAIRYAYSDTMTKEDINYADVFLDMFDNQLRGQKEFQMYERKDQVIIAKEKADQEMGILSQEVRSKYFSEGVTKIVAVIIKKVEKEDKLSILIKLIDAEDGEIIHSTQKLSKINSTSFEKTARKMAEALAEPLKKENSEQKR